MVDIKIAAFGPDIGTMVDDGNGKSPDQIRYFDLEIDTRGNGVGFRVVNSGIQNLHATPEDQRWIVANGLVAAAIDNDEIPNATPAVFDRSNGANRKRRYSISLNNPRPVRSNGQDFDEAKRCLFVFRLASGRGNSKANWRFSSSFAPFSIGDRSVEANGNSIDLTDVFSHATHCRDDNIEPIFLVPDEDEKVWPDKYNSSNWAYFLYDYENAKNLMGTDDFVFRYNLHVEIEDIGRPGHFIPIIIDPDIGHPGGNNTGP